MSRIDESIFRAYDIRGIVGESLTEEAVDLIGQAIGSEAQDQGEKTLIIARDGRLSSPDLSQSLCEGILKTGCDVIDIGEVPTPLLYFATYVLSHHSGVMLTGSHNPSNYNGLKVVLKEKALSGEEIQALYQRVLRDDFRKGSGQFSQEEVIDRYLECICSDVKLDRSLKVVIDSGNGIGGKVAPILFHRLGCEVMELFCEVDGHFPNHHPDPSNLNNLQDLINTVKETKADVGLAFDGDADRLGVVTNEGMVIWPDRQLLLFAVDVLSRHKGAKIVYEVKCTRNLEKVIKEHGGEPIMYKTGHSFIKAKIKESGALLAGEMSGHIFFKERWYGFDDGLYAGARLLEILSKQPLSSDELFKTLPDSINTPELKCPIEESQKFKFMEKFQNEVHFPEARVTEIDGFRADFKEGWGLIRPSNTTPYLILRFEADNESDLKTIQERFRKALLQLDSTLILPF